MTLREKLSASDSKLNDVVRVAGTDYDRRRKLTNRELYSMRRSYQSPNIDIYYLAEKFDVSPQTVKYHVDPEYKKRMNAKRKDYAFNTVQSSSYSHELAEYKRSLLSMGKRLATNI